MKKEVSRSLRRKLLIALISCLLAVLGICTAVFNIINQKASVNVNLYSTALVGQTVSTVSDAYYQQFLCAMQNNIKNFCNERSLELHINEMYQDFTGEAYSESPEDYCRSLFFSAETYFSETDYVFLTYDGKTLQSQTVSDGQDASDITDAAFAAFDLMAADAPEYFAGHSNYADYLSETYSESNGIYTKDGNGYVIAWHNMNTDSEYNIACGILMYNVNDCIQPIKQAADIQTGDLLSNMDSLFRKYFSMMIVSVICVFIVFLLISAILSKKIADPVVSEHDMLVQVNEMKTTFLSDASHELKTPLAAMSGYAQDAELDLLNGGETETVQAKLKRISSEANRMALMVTQILDATRIEEGRMVLEKAPCDLDSLVRQTVETYFAVLNKNNNRLILRIPLDLPKVDADSARLQRVFVNLVSNALKHTKNGKILIKAEANDEMVTVTVKDTGSGISPEDLPHIWERYYKGKHSETGTGLGLFICKFIVESHGGTIGVESELEKGTTFTFTIPTAAESAVSDDENNPIEHLLRR